MFRMVDYTSVAFFSVVLLLPLSLLLLRSRSRSRTRGGTLSCRWTCPISMAYLTSSWTAHFPNRSDWYAHLLRLSPTGTIYIAVLGNTITANPANVEHMLRTNFSNYPKGKQFAYFTQDMLGHGIFNTDGENWLFQRKLASLELGSNSVRAYAFRIVTNEISTRLFPLFDVAAGGDALDLQDVFRRFSLDTISKISFGLDAGCLDLSMPITQFARAFDEASSLTAARATTVLHLWKAKRFLNIGSERRLRSAIALINLLAAEVIKKKKAAAVEVKSDKSTAVDNTRSHDLLSRFMSSVDDERLLRDIVVSFLLAGRDTVASTLTAFFLLVSTHPEAESKILDEISEAMPSDEHEDSATPSYSQLRRMPFVHAALYETLRLYPPVQFDSKFAASDDVLPDGTFVRKGTRVTYHAYAMGRMESLWGKDCMEFKPERWLSDDGKAFVPVSPFTFPVFHAGFRVCLGKELAIMESKTVAVSLLRRYRVELLLDKATAHSPKFATGLTASLKGGLPVRIHKRASIQIENPCMVVSSTG